MVIVPFCLVTKELAMHRTLKAFVAVNVITVTGLLVVQIVCYSRGETLLITCY